MAEKVGKRMWSDGILLLATTALVGCSEANIDDLKRFVEATRTGAGAEVESFPKMPELHRFTLDRAAIGNPFIDYSLEGYFSHGGTRTREVSDAEFYSVADYSLVKVEGNKNEFYALLKTPDGVVYRKKAGMVIGKEKAVVEKIDRDQVVVTVEGKAVQIK